MTTVIHFNPGNMTMNEVYTDIWANERTEHPPIIKKKTHAHFPMANPWLHRYTGADSTCTKVGRQHIKCLECEQSDCLLRG